MFNMDDALINVIRWLQYHNWEILNRETAIQLLKNDISKMALELKTKRIVNNNVDTSIVTFFKKYKQQVGYIETEFLTWKQTANQKFEASLY
jgi:hypothetical protein